jgi:hypothetical protein
MMLRDCICVFFLSFERVGSEFVVFALLCISVCPYCCCNIWMDLLLFLPYFEMGDVLLSYFITKVLRMSVAEHLHVLVF